ncbi:hypothetical protein OC845_005548 [Tilletia horrida]|nr:hypothetical protein OC845_005548 [Tilletia horrida]
MEWSTDLDLTLRSVPWSPLRCADQLSSESRIFLAKFYIPPSDSTSCALLLFDCESAQAYFEPVRASRLIRRCTRLPSAGPSDLHISGLSSQDDSDFKVQIILASLQRAFSPHHSKAATYKLAFSVQCSRHATTLEICMNSTKAPEGNFSFTFEADSLDHEQAASVFLNHWALPLLGATSSLNRLLESKTANIDLLLPSMQEEIDKSAQSAQHDHCDPILDVFQSAFLTTSLTRWSEMHLRREQPSAILATYGSMEVPQPRGDVGQARHQGGPAHGLAPKHQERLATGLPAHSSSSSTNTSSQDASSFSGPSQPVPEIASAERDQVPPASQLSTPLSSPQALKRPSPGSNEPTGQSSRTTQSTADLTSPSLSPAQKRAKIEESVSRDAQILYGGVAFQGMLPNPSSTSSSGAHNAPVIADPSEEPPADFAHLSARPKRNAAIDSAYEPRGTPASSADAPMSSGTPPPPGSPASPQKEAPASSRPVMAPLRRGGAPARGTARARRF